MGSSSSKLSSKTPGAFRSSPMMLDVNFSQLPVTLEPQHTDNAPKKSIEYPDMIRDYVKRYKIHKFKTASKFCNCREIVLYGYIHDLESACNLAYGIPDGIYDICRLYFGMTCNDLSYEWRSKMISVAEMVKNMSDRTKQKICKDYYYLDGKNKFDDSIPKFVCSFIKYYVNTLGMASPKKDSLRALLKEIRSYIMPKTQEIVMYKQLQNGIMTKEQGVDKIAEYLKEFGGSELNIIGSTCSYQCYRNSV